MSFPSQTEFPSSPTFSPEKFVLFEGDSLTSNNGNGITPYPDKLIGKPGFVGEAKYFNLAKSGDRASDFLNTFYEQIGAFGHSNSVSADKIIFVWLGTNDLAFDNSSTVFNSLLGIWQAARTQGFQVIAFTISVRDSSPEIEQKRNEVNSMIRSASEEYDVLMDMDLWFSDPTNLNIFYDGLHFTEWGTQQVADQIAHLLGNI